MSPEQNPYDWKGGSAAIPLGVEAYERNEGFNPETKLQNLILEQDKYGQSPDGIIRIQRPGLSDFYESGGEPIRAIYQQEGIQYGEVLFIAGDKLLRTDGATATELATVGDDGRIAAICSTYNRVGVVSDGKFLITTLETGEIEEMEVPDSHKPVWVDSINGYFVIACEDGTFYWVVPAGGLIGPLNFATAESSPDGLLCIKRLGDELFMFGGSTTEVWQITGDFEAPFTRAPGRSYEKGCKSAATVQKFDNTLVWVGDDNIVYRASNVPQRMSTHAIEERLRNSTAEPTAFTFGFDAHLFYVLRIPGQGSFAFDASSGKWSEFSSFGDTSWRPRVGVSTPSGSYVGDGRTGKLYFIDPNSYTDAGQPIERVVSGSVSFNGRPNRNDSLSIFAGSDRDTVLQARWYDGRETPGDWTEVPLRATVDNPTLFRLGAAQQPIRTFEIRCVEDAAIRISGAVLNQGWRRS